MKRSIIQLGIQAFRLLSKKQRVEALLNVVCSILQAILEVVSLTAVIPLLYPLLEPGSYPGKYENNFVLSLSWPVALGALILVFFIKNILTLWLANYQSTFVNGISVSFSEKLYQRFYTQRWIQYLQENSAEAVRKIKGTSSDYANYVLLGYLTLLTDMLICFIMVSFIAWFNYPIVFVLLVLLFPIIFLYFLFKKNIISKVDKSFRELTPQASIILAQGVDSFAEAVIYKKESFFIDKFMQIRRITSRQMARLTVANGIPLRVFEVTGILCFSGIIVYAKKYNTDHQQLILVLGLLTVSMYRIIPSLNRILINLAQIQTYSYAVSELENSFDLPEQNLPSIQREIEFTQSIELKNVSFAYRKQSHNYVLTNINIKINKGDFLIVEGSSGSGKTTLIHLLAGLIQDYNGEIFIDSTTLTSESLQAWQSKIGFVSQAPIVLQDTLLNNITFGQMNDAVDLQRVKSALELSGLLDFANSSPQQWQTSIGENGLTLSGGQRQRLILARALYQDPEVLLLDEVTNQLDERNKLNILQNLKSLSQRGKTIILATHDPVVKGFATHHLNILESKITRIQQS